MDNDDVHYKSGFWRRGKKEPSRGTDGRMLLTRAIREHSYAAATAILIGALLWIVAIMFLGLNGPAVRIIDAERYRTWVMWRHGLLFVTGIVPFLAMWRLIKPLPLSVGNLVLVLWVLSLAVSLLVLGWMISEWNRCDMIPWCAGTVLGDKDTAFLFVFWATVGILVAHVIVFIGLMMLRSVSNRMSKLLIKGNYERIHIAEKGDRPETVYDGAPPVSREDAAAAQGSGMPPGVTYEGGKLYHDGVEMAPVGSQLSEPFGARRTPAGQPGARERAACRGETCRERRDLGRCRGGRWSPRAE